MNNTYVEYLVEKHRRCGIIVDSNLMLLMVIGTYDVNKIRRCNRTLKYSPAIFELVVRLVSLFERRFTTPNILTEVDNLARLDIHESEWSSLGWIMNSLIDGLIERSKSTASLARHTLYERLGLADCSIMFTDDDDLLVLTDDLRLSSFLMSAGRGVINVSHLIANSA